MSDIASREDRVRGEALMVAAIISDSANEGAQNRIAIVRVAGSHVKVRNVQPGKFHGP
jgi:hypothetical protein